MISKYKIKNTLQNLPFYSEKTNNTKQNNKKFTNGKILSELPLFPKNTKKLSNYQLSKELPVFAKRPKKVKKKHQILKNILPFYDRVGILKRQRTLRGCAETYNVETVDKKSLSDPLFLAISSIVDLFSDLLQETRGFKYILSTTITLKRWNNGFNKYDIEKFYLNSEAITVTNQELNLAT